MQKVTIHWFRRDLRLEDNTALIQALKKEENVLPIFIFDKDILEKLETKKDARVQFIHEKLELIKEELKVQFQSDILIFHDEVLNAFKKLTEEYTVQAVYTNEDYETYGIERDKRVKAFLESKNIVFNVYKDHVIFAKKEILKADGEIYKVYTPYMRKWKEKLSEKNLMIQDVFEVENNFLQNVDFSFPSLTEIGFEKTEIEVIPYHLDKPKLNSYVEKRDFPSVDGTSSISPHLRFGTVSIRKLVHYALNTTDSKQVYLNELIWREFFMQLFYNNQRTAKESFRPEYDRILWRTDEEDFKKWCEGKTGYPMVDAGMRELNATGYMHNRVRMVVGSFLCKHLMIDWRWGERYFAEKLLDFELSSNVGNWQWVAGCGADAAPYFRIFNPETQLTKFDKDLKYVKKWIPEYGTSKYPKPMVDHKFARERALEMYKEGLGK
ncbi:cryptochrome/photolyase family protein [Aureivirga sp. CE67]|uniref:cryptochrome/photolyase family protein n=1 Tax=Aureivirga sp. CE67 TaxID=1788983 RepID=UPI0018CA30BE|nr:deoxyribodipyrimidine photo-lyase [Aureivirga sp. CE67]